MRLSICQYKSWLTNWSRKHLQINQHNNNGEEEGDDGIDCAESNQAVDDEVDAAVEDDEEPGSVVTDDGGQGDLVLQPGNMASLDCMILCRCYGILFSHCKGCCWTREVYYTFLEVSDPA